MAKQPTVGGGAATHAGTNYQDYVAAWVAVQILAEQDISPPWGLPASVTLEALHAEAPRPIDDLTVHTSVSGKALLQAKHTVTLATTATSPLGSTIAQFVTEYRTAGTPFDPQHDRFVLVTSPHSSDPIKYHLPIFLQRFRTSSELDQEWTSGNQAERRAAQILRDHITREWQTHAGMVPTPAEIASLTKLIYLHILDVDPGGQAATEAKNTLRQRILKDPTQDENAWNTLTTTAGSYAANHQRADRAALQRALTDANINLEVQRSYRADIGCLKHHTTTMLGALVDFSRLRMGNREVTIQRSATAAARTAAADHHLLLIGTPGAGKSGTLYDVATTLQAQGADVVLLVVDQLEASSTGNLRTELGLTHELPSILAAWPGTAPAYLIIDALDAARTVGASRTLLAIMQQVMTTTTRWRVMASVRKFDLRYSSTIQNLFRGNPPSTHLDAEFTTIRHVNVPTLTDDELSQLATEAPALYALVQNASPALQALLRTPFNLRILAELLTLGIATTELEPLRTQVELLDRYWRERIVRDDGQGDARELILRRTTDAMVRQRSLRIPRSTALGNETAASTVLNDLLRTHVLAEWTTQAGTAQREILTFPHHLLFDYAVARLSIPQTPTAFATSLTAEPDLLLAIRPSIEIHYQRLWHNNLTAFWELTFQTIRARIPEIGKLIGPSVAALQAETVTQFQPLLDQLLHNDATTREEGRVALSHVLSTYFANSGNARTTPWCELIDACTSTMTPEVAGTVRPSVWHLSGHANHLTTGELRHLGATARRLLTYALTITPNDHGLAITAIVGVNKSVSADISASITLLRECITPERLKSAGYQTLRYLAEGVLTIAIHDPHYLHDLYVAALRNEDTSQETTSMGNSQILPMSSRRQQDYRGGYYILGLHYPVFLQYAPGPAVATLCEALTRFPQGRDHRRAEPRPVTLGTHKGFLLPDGSNIWDDMGVYGDELPTTMASHLQERLHKLADANDELGITHLLAACTAQPAPAILWRRLLLAGTRHPATLGLHFHSLAWDTTILTTTETTRTAGTFLGAIHPLLDAEERTRIEQTIMALPLTDRWDTHDRDRLIGCLKEEHLASQRVREHFTVLTAQGGPPPNAEGHGSPTWAKIPDDPEPDDPLQLLITPLTGFLGRDPNNAPDLDTVANVLPQANALNQALAILPDPHSPDRARAASIVLLRAATRLSRAGGLAADHCTQLVDILISAATHAEPAPDDDTIQDRPVTGWSDAPRLLAAEGLVILARYPAACTPATQAAIRSLGADLVPAVRWQISRQLGCLYPTAPELYWELLERYASNEPNPSVLVNTLHTLGRMPTTHVTRTIALARQILERTPRAEERNEVRDAAIHIFSARYLDCDEPTCTAFIEQLITHPASNAKDLQRLILDLSVDFTASDAALRTRVYALTERILTNTVAAMTAIETANEQQTQWPDEEQKLFSRLTCCADEIAQRLYLTSGAFKHPNNDSTLLPAETFYNHAKPLLARLTAVGHPHTAYNVLGTLKHFIALDPADILIIIGDTVRTSSRYGYQLESLAETLMVEMVEEYLTEYRAVLRERPECHAALMDVLDAFVRVGWPRAHQLTYRLSEIYR